MANTLNAIYNPPVITITGGPSGIVRQSTVTFTWSSDEQATFECAMDTGAFTGCGSGLSGAVTYAGLSLATHQFKVRGTDIYNKGSSPDQRSFTVTADTTPPPTPVLGQVPPDPSGPSATFTFTDAESGVTFSCSVDGGSAQPCASPQSYAGLATGSHTFSVMAADASAN